MFFPFEKDLDRQKYIYTKGCVGQFEKWLQENLIIVAGIFVGIALLQVSLCKQLFLQNICDFEISRVPKTNMNDFVP